MKKTFDVIKQILIDNKEYFIKCTLMSVIAALIIGLAVCLSVPASAASDPIESDQVIIPSGTYSFNDIVYSLPYQFSFDIPFTFIAYIDSIGYVQASATSMSGSPQPDLFNIWWLVSSVSSTSPDLSDYGIVYPLDYDLIDISDGTPFISSFTVTSDVSVNNDIGSWFFANTVRLDGYLIEAGFYKNRGGWNTSVFPAMNDSIDIRYYDQFNDGYRDTEGMIFIVENQIVTIYYGDDAVYTDGWNSYAYENIEVTEDIYVYSDFYTAFNSVFAPSTQSSNDFDTGYSVGYDQGRLDGYDEGYQQGFLVGANEDGTFFGNVIEGVLDALDKLVIVGDISILDIIKTVIGGFVLIFFLKLIAGG